MSLTRWGFWLCLSAGSLTAPAIAAPAPAEAREQVIGAGVILTDARGFTLNSYDRDRPGASFCTQACAKAWPPFAAPADAKDIGDWRSLAREDGTRQWAYRGKPLYLYGKDAAAGTQFGDNAANYAWHTAFVPLATPAGLDVRTIDLGRALIDYRGMTLYARDDEANGRVKCVGACLTTWLPITAPGMATAFGPWTIVKRPDGSGQWAHDGRPLYAFADDQRPGDYRGEGRDKTWHALILTPAAARPAWVTVQAADVGPIYADAKGLTLYVGPETFDVVKKRTCNEACLETTVRLVTAEKDAKPIGDWSLNTVNGQSVWAYRGSTLYTNTRDRRPGDIRGDGWAGGLGAQGFEPILALVGQPEDR